MLGQNEIQEEKRLAQMFLFSSKAKDWKSRVANAAEQVLVCEPTEAARRTTEVQKTMAKQFQFRWREAEAQLRDMHESNSAQQTLRMSQDMEHQALSMAHQREQEIQRTQGSISSSSGSPESPMEQISQTAYKAETHALHRYPSANS